MLDAGGGGDDSSLMDIHGFLVIFTRLGIAAFLVLIGIGSVRVLVQIRIERRRKERLAATKDICSLNPSEFEAYVGVLFERAGYRVKRTGGKGDRGIDLMVKRNGKTRVVQCKRYGDDVGPGAVRELIGAMTNAGATQGVLVTTSGFTPGAEREAGKAPYDIQLLDGSTLLSWAKRYGLPGEVMSSR